MPRRTPPSAPPASPPASRGEMMQMVDMLPVPTRSTDEREADDSLTQRIMDLADDLRTRNLANGLALAQQAAGRRGQLVGVFAEIGRRYAHLLDETGGRTVLTEAGPVKLPLKRLRRTALRVIEGGSV